MKKLSILTLSILNLLESVADKNLVISDLSQNDISVLTDLDRYTIKACIDELESYEIVKVERIWGKTNSYRLKGNYKELLQEFIGD